MNDKNIAGYMNIDIFRGKGFALMKSVSKFKWTVLGKIAVGFWFKMRSLEQIFIHLSESK